MRAVHFAVLAFLAFALGSAGRAPGAAIVLPAHGAVRILDRAQIAVGHPSVTDVLGENADFRPYAPRLLAGWPVDAWLRFSVAPAAGGRWLLQLPGTEWAELYAPDGRGGYARQVTGTTVAFDARSVPYATPSFTIDAGGLAPGTPFYLHVRYHPDMPFAPTLRDTQTFFNAAMTQRLLHGLFLGVLLTIVALGAYVVIVLRYQATGLFTLYLAALVINELVTTGLGNQYLWPQFGGDARLATLLVNALAFGSFVLFVRTLLQTRAHTPWLDALLVTNFAVQMAVAVALYVTPLSASLVLPLLAIELFGTALIYIIGVRRWSQGSRTAAFFVLAFVPAGAGALANIWYDVTLPAGNWFWAANGVELGTMIECIMMAAIVLNRINLVHRERQTARTQLTAHAEKNVELRRIAHTDPLTGVANRLRFYDELDEALALAKEQPEPVGVLYVDLDGFKQINDVRGHLAGDDVLRSVAHRLIALAREQDLVARLGGDEFAVLLRHLPSEAMLEAVRERVTGSFEIAGTAVSVGSSVYPRDGATADEIVDAADRSMYRMKEMRKSASARAAVS